MNLHENFIGGAPGCPAAAYQISFDFVHKFAVNSLSKLAVAAAVGWSQMKSWTGRCRDVGIDLEPQAAAVG